jgi:hypothetical protein
LESQIGLVLRFFQGAVVSETSRVIKSIFNVRLRTTIVIVCMANNFDSENAEFLHEAIERTAGPGVTLVDSAENCALAVKALLEKNTLSAPQERLGKLDVALTDATERFLRTAARALDLEIGDVSLRSVQNIEETRYQRL